MTTYGRADLIRTAGAAAAAAAVGITAAGRHTAAQAKPSAEQDREVLNLLLLVEQTESAFYAQALETGRLTGEMAEFAEVVAGHEREHVAFLREQLGSAARAEPAYEFGEAVRDPAQFARTAARLEDIAVAAYNGQAANVTPAAFEAAARIVSVEARHAAWIRAIDDRDPAPDATDAPQTADEVREALREIGARP
jgi:truncated hemoglobin YjbI